jgi:hypothetical protein
MSTPQLIIEFTKVFVWLLLAGFLLAGVKEDLAYVASGGTIGLFLVYMFLSPDRNPCHYHPF